MMFKGMNCLVTGGTGLIGRQVVKLLCDAGANVRIASMDNLNVDDRAEHQLIDLTDFWKCKEVTKEMDYVFHLAGVKGSPKVTTEKPASFFVPMLMFNTNVLEACRINNVKRVVYTSSIGAYTQSNFLKEDEASNGEPMDTYPGWAKRMAEKQIETYKIQYSLENFSIVRLGTVYGPGDNFDPDNAMVIPSLMAKIYRGDSPLKVWGDGSAVRDFAFSRDIAEGIFKALMFNTGAQIVNLGGGKGYSVKKLVETLNSFIDFNYEFDTSKPTGISRRIMSIALAQKTIGFNPETSLLDGLKETWEWYKDNQDEHLKRKNYFKEQ